MHPPSNASSGESVFRGRPTCYRFEATPKDRLTVDVGRQPAYGRRAARSPPHDRSNDHADTSEDSTLTLSVLSRCASVLAASAAIAAGPMTLAAKANCANDNAISVARTVTL